MPSSTNIPCVDYLLAGYCREVGSQCFAPLSNDVLKMVHLFFPKMNGTKFIWTIDKSVKNEILNANLSHKNLNRNNAWSNRRGRGYYRTAMPRYTNDQLTDSNKVEFDSQTFDVKLNDKNVFKFFLKLSPNFKVTKDDQKTENNTIPNAPSAINTGYYRSYGIYTQRGSRGRGRGRGRGRFGDPPPQQHQPVVDNTHKKENNNSLILKIMGLPLPHSIQYIIFHIELYCLNTKSMYTSIWRFNNSPDGQPRGPGFAVPIKDSYNSLQWYPSTLMMKDIINMNHITFECNMNILQIKNKTVNKEKGKKNKPRNYYKSIVQYDPYSGNPSIINAYPYYTYYINDNYNSKMRFQWILDDSYIINQLKYDPVNTEYPLKRFHSDIYYGMFCLTLTVMKNATKMEEIHNNSNENNWMYQSRRQQQQQQQNTTINDNKKVLLLGLQLVGLPFKSTKISIQLKIRCAEYNNNSCLMSNFVPLSYDNPYYYIANKNILCDLLKDFTCNQLTFNCDIQIIDLYNNLNESVLNGIGKELNNDNNKKKNDNVNVKPIINNIGQEQFEKDKNDLVTSINNLQNELKNISRKLISYKYRIINNNNNNNTDFDLKKEKYENICDKKEQFKIWLLDTVGLSQYYDNFIKQGIDTLEIVRLVNPVALKDEIGIKMYGHRLKINKEIQKLRIKNSEPNILYSITNQQQPLHKTY